MTTTILGKIDNNIGDVKPVFYRYPKSTQVNRVIPKNKLYEQAKVNATIRELFVTQVEQIIWINKLSAQTLNIETHEQITEIQIFKIVLKGEELATEVLQTIDKAIMHPIMFEIASLSNKSKMVASYKTISAKATVILSDYYRSPWCLGQLQSDAMQLDSQSSNDSWDNDRSPLPLALNTKGLYEQLLASLLPYPLKEGEVFTELIKRIDVINKLKKQQQQINKRLSNEKQFKHKVLINAELKKVKKQLKQLIA